MKNYIALSILLSGLCLDSARATGAALRAAGSQYEGNRMLATDEPTAFEPTPVAAPVSEPTQAAFGDDTVCAEHDERSVQCGAIDPTRPSACCSGLACQGKKCIDPSIAPVEEPTSEPPAIEGDGSCAGDGDRSQQCGASRADFPASCCEGLVCEDALAGVKCIMPTPGAEPVSEPVVEEITCAASGVRSQECGATRSDLAASCCEGLVCEGNGSVKCADAPVETPEPTKAPVVAPEPTEAISAVVETPEPTEIVAAETTASPTIGFELEPTGQPTPGDVEIVTSSSVSTIATKAALTAAVVVPMVFF